MSLDLGSRKRMADAANPSPLRNGLYNVGGQVVRGAVAVLALPFLIRFLGISEYGVWSLAYALLALMTMCETGFSVAAAVFLSKDLAADDTREASHTLTFIVISAALLSVALGLLLWFTGPFLVRPLTSFGSSERAAAGRALQIAGFGVSILILQRTLVGFEQAFDRYGVINALDLAQALLTSVGLVAVAGWGGRTVAMMTWYVFASAVLLIAHTCVVIRLFRQHALQFKWNGRKGRQIFRHSLATWIATLGSAAFSQCDRLIVGWVLGAPSLGIYSAITNITSKINSLSATAVQPLVPSLSRDVTLDVPAQDRIRQATYLNALIATEAGIFLYVLADWVMRVLGPGVAARQSILGLQIAAVVYALYSFSAPGFYILFSVGGARTNAVVILSSGVISLVLILLGARFYGLLGALAGNAGYLCTLLLLVAGLKKTGIALSRFLNWTALPLLSLGAASVVGIFLQDHFFWRAIFVIVQAVVVMFWFLHDHDDGRRIEFGLGWPVKS